MHMNRPTDERLLLVFAHTACMRIGLPEPSLGMQYHFLLDSYLLGFDADQKLTINFQKGNWFLQNEAIREGKGLTIALDNGEEVTLLLSERKQTLRIAGRLNLAQLSDVRIGSDYPNQIFYECSVGMLKQHAKISRREDGYYLYSSKEIYVNEKRVNGESKLRTGDQVDLYGLHLLLINDWLICISFYGACHVAQTGLPYTTTYPAKKAYNESIICFVERNYEQEKQLHSGEIELQKPTEPTQKQRSKLFLSIGPSVTMAFPMLLMAFLASRTSGQMGNGFYFLTAGMTVCTGTLAVLWGFVNHFYRKHTDKEDEQNRRKQYREYLNNLRHDLQQYKIENLQTLESRYPPTWHFLNQDNRTAVVAWNRYYLHQDYLFIRLGKGSIPFQVKLKMPKGNGIIPETLMTEAFDLQKDYETIDHAPFGLDLFKVRQMGMIVTQGGRDTEQWMKLLIMQISACLCYTEVKIICFYDESRNNHREIVNCIKWLPHNWSTDRKTRYLAGNESEAAEILPILTKNLEQEKQTGEKKRRIPWYVFILLNESLLQGESLYRYLTDSKEAYPVSTIWMSCTQENLPRSCSHILTRKVIGEELFIYGDEITRYKICMDRNLQYDAEKYARNISGFRVKEEISQNQIPEKVGFLKLFGQIMLEGLDLETRWRNGKTEERLKIPIGQGKGGKNVYLDIHEKFHGPHGLIAGTTGSGKSELLQSYLLSMAVCFSPLDVNFFMIDYKGGGTGNLLSKLPHCAGVISNLSGNQIRRAMLAISSENKRRQKLLSKFQVNHINHYTRLFREGKVSEPMPHLILVVDEFAELKKEEPEFMQEIISLAQVGRSLGVHLILATQKPAGTVDDKIWSNARFRLCLKVQDKQDSMDMLHCADAARLTSPGQCYLQIGNQEYYELFQTAYCGECYSAEPSKIPSAALVTNTGQRTNLNYGVVSKEQTTILEALTDYISDIARNNQYCNAQSLWMPELPQRIDIKNLAEKGNDWLDLKLGLCDDPSNQEQPVLYYNPIKDGSLAIFGGAATGKSTLLQTILYQLSVLANCNTIQYLIADYSRGSLQCFASMPHCLSILKNISEQDIFFYHLKKLIIKRKHLLAGVSCLQYNEQAKEKLPIIFMVVDGYRNFAEKLNEKQAEFMIKLAAEGVNYGIYLLLSAAAGEIPGRVFEKIQNSITFELNDRYQYGDVLRQYRVPVYPKGSVKGRGLCKQNGIILEFQAALLFEKVGDYQRMQMIGQKSKELSEITHKSMNCKYKFPHIPEKADELQMKAEYDQIRQEGTIPLGYSLLTGEIQVLNYLDTRCFLISGAGKTGKRTLATSLMNSFLQKQYTVLGINLAESMPDTIPEIFQTTTLEEAEKLLEVNATSVKEKLPVIIFIRDLTAFCLRLYESDVPIEQRKYWEKLAAGRKPEYFIVAVYHLGKDYSVEGTVFFRNFVKTQNGIHLGGNAGAQRILTFDDMSYAELNCWEKPGIGYWKNGQGSTTQKLLLPRQGKDEDDCN